MQNHVSNTNQTVTIPRNILYSTLIKAGLNQINPSILAQKDPIQSNI